MNDDFSDLPPRLTLREFFAQVQPPTGPPPTEKFPGPLFLDEPFE